MMATDMPLTPADQLLAGLRISAASVPRASTTGGLSTPAPGQASSYTPLDAGAQSSAHRYGGATAAATATSDGPTALAGNIMARMMMMSTSTPTGATTTATPGAAAAGYDRSRYTSLPQQTWQSQSQQQHPDDEEPMPTPLPPTTTRAAPSDATRDILDASVATASTAMSMTAGGAASFTTTANSTNGLHQPHYPVAGPELDDDDREFNAALNALAADAATEAGEFGAAMATLRRSTQDNTRVVADRHAALAAAVAGGGGGHTKRGPLNGSSSRSSTGRRSGKRRGRADGYVRDSATELSRLQRQVDRYVGSATMPARGGGTKRSSSVRPVPMTPGRSGAQGEIVTAAGVRAAEAALAESMRRVANGEPPIFVPNALSTARSVEAARSVERQRQLLVHFKSRFDDLEATITQHTHTELEYVVYHNQATTSSVCSSLTKSQHHTQAHSCRVAREAARGTGQGCASQGRLDGTQGPPVGSRGHCEDRARVHAAGALLPLAVVVSTCPFVLTHNPFTTDASLGAGSFGAPPCRGGPQPTCAAGGV